MARALSETQRRVHLVGPSLAALAAAAHSARDGLDFTFVGDSLFTRALLSSDFNAPMGN